ncbi:hypothetical protein KIN20_012984 [Parelaphostrongylus tenuis]|uniref:Uncharacterized protein n=1 Tax=Parelaphostrongylus tenuis TaxID=148309 RepID=A0AAD5MEW2_PARTN|nr:hypothetical protein KIN20_012984 [Parelaphostrongylus tenuis]
MFCDVYEQQYGSAVGPTNALTSSSSPNHLSVETNYTPLECNVVLTDPAATGNNCIQGTGNHCLVIENTVTSLYAADLCVPNATKILTPIPGQYLAISGHLKTTNLVMMSWRSKAWQMYLDNVINQLLSGPFGANFLLSVAFVAQNLKCNMKHVQ